MDYRAIFHISAAGMNVEKLRLETAALNLANMHTTSGPGGVAFRPLHVVARAVVPDFSAWMQPQASAALGGTEAVAVPMDNTPPRLVHDPGHPDADANGDVRYPGVDHTAEMINVMTALRSYEANVAAVSAARSLAARALEIGGQS